MTWTSTALAPDRASLMIDLSVIWSKEFITYNLVFDQITYISWKYAFEKFFMFLPCLSLMFHPSTAWIPGRVKLILPMWIVRWIVSAKISFFCSKKSMQILIEAHTSITTHCVTFIYAMMHITTEKCKTMWWHRNQTHSLLITRSYGFVFDDELLFEWMNKWITE